MLSQQQLHARTRNWLALSLIALVWSVPAPLFAQESAPSFLSDVGKRVLLDPTTYAPSIVAYIGTKKDWNTSQPLFRYGLNELNPRFTISGLPNDVPVSYEEGNRRILRDALFNLQTSLIANTTVNTLEYVLVRWSPEHRKLWRRLGWVERISAAAALSYYLSHQHFEQAVRNEQNARQMGLIP